MLCPNADCPYAKKRARPAEYRAGIALCTDCGASLVEASAMPSTPGAFVATTAQTAAAAPWPPHVVRALVVTVVVAAATLALGFVPLPYVDSEALYLMVGQAPGRALTTVSAGALGVMPWLSAAIVVEIVAFLVPALRRKRHAGPDARASLEKAALILGALLAVAQAWMAAVWLASLSGMYVDSVAPELWALGPKLLVIATMVAGACIARLAAFVIDRHGVSNGLIAITGAALVLDVADELRKQWTMLEGGVTTPVTLVMSAAMFAVPAVLAWRFVSVRPSSSSSSSSSSSHESDPAFVVRPSAGIVPATVAFVVPSIAAAVATFADVALSTMTTTILGVVAAAALVPVCASLWSSPQRIALFRARSQGRTQPDASDVAAARAETADARMPTFVLNGVIVAALAVSTHWLPYGFMNGVAIIVLAATARDVIEELRARRALGRDTSSDGLVSVWSLHRMDLVNPLLHVLEREGIAHVALRGAHVRALSHFFAPWVPVEILVDANDAARARSIVRVAIESMLRDAKT